MKYLISISTLLAFSTVQPALADEWTGFYGTAAMGMSRMDVSGTQGFREDDDSDLAFLGGLGLGGNLQYGNFVLGLEGDVSALGNSTSLGMKDTVTADADWFATARARAGYQADGTLFYATAGLAAVSLELANANGSDREQMKGWAVGGGLERQISERLNLKAEGLYLRFDKETLDLDTSLDFGRNPDIVMDSSMIIARVGLTYGF